MLPGIPGREKWGVTVLTGTVSVLKDKVLEMAVVLAAQQYEYS